jgi:two-component system sensor histidine kinase UhpB
MMHAEWLPVVMQGSFSEIYVIDCDTLQFVQVNQAACANLQFDEHDLLGKTPVEISRNLTMETMELVLQPLRDGIVSQANLETMQVRKDGTVYPIEYHFFLCMTTAESVFIAIGNDVTARYEAAKALRISESRFRAIVSNTPGLVFQVLQREEGGISFPYLSDGCHALLGVPADKLRSDPEFFVSLVLPEDRPSYLESMRQSALDMKSWNWEGRIWIEAWQDTKWINLRATPRRLAGGATQWEGIMSNINDSKLEQAEIKRSRAQLAELSAHVETVKEKERTRIAREIHDDLGGI